MQPLFSVVVTTHDRPNLLERAISSLLKQTFSNFEILLCADKSDKRTIDVAQKTLRSSDSLVITPNLQGPAETRNLGIHLSRGSWILFLDDDDSFCDTYLEEASTAISEKNLIWFVNYHKILESRDCSTPLMISTEKVRIDPISSANLLVQNFIPINSIIVPSLIAKAHPFNRFLNSHEDWDWLISLKLSGYSFIGIKEIFGPNVHSDPAVKSRNRSESIGLDHLAIYLRWPAKTDEIKKLRSQLLSQFNVNIHPQHF